MPSINEFDSHAASTYSVLSILLILAMGVIVTLRFIGKPMKVDETVDDQLEVIRGHIAQIKDLMSSLDARSVIACAAIEKLSEALSVVQQGIGNQNSFNNLTAEHLAELQKLVDDFKAHLDTKHQEGTRP